MSGLGVFHNDDLMTPGFATVGIPSTRISSTGMAQSRLVGSQVAWIYVERVQPRQVGMTLD